MSERLAGPVAALIYEVWQGNTLICSRKMKLTRAQAQNKVDNERRRGSRMEIRLVLEKKP